MRQTRQAKLALRSLIGLSLPVSGNGPTTVAFDSATGERLLADLRTTKTNDR